MIFEFGCCLECCVVLNCVRALDCICAYLGLELLTVFRDMKKEDGVFGTAAWHRVCSLICVLRQLAWI